MVLGNVVTALEDKASKRRRGDVAGAARVHVPPSRCEAHAIITRRVRWQRLRAILCCVSRAAASASHTTSTLRFAVASIEVRPRKKNLACSVKSAAPTPSTRCPKDDPKDMEILRLRRDAKLRAALVDDGIAALRLVKLHTSYPHGDGPARPPRHTNRVVGVAPAINVGNRLPPCGRREHVRRSPGCPFLPYIDSGKRHAEMRRQEPFDDERRRAPFQGVGPFEFEFQRPAKSPIALEKDPSLRNACSAFTVEAPLLRVWFDREHRPPARVQQRCPVVLALLVDDRSERRRRLGRARWCPRAAALEHAGVGRGPCSAGSR